MKSRNSHSIWLLALLCLALSGCSSMGKTLKSFFSGEDKKPVAQNHSQENVPQTDQPDTFDKDNMATVAQRQYGRMTRSRMEQESNLSPKAGSLWVREGQGAYLFSDNNFRLVGDLLNVKLDGAPKDHLTSKAKILKELWKKIDRPQRAPAGAKAGGAPAEGAAAPAPAAPEPAAAAPGAAPVVKEEEVGGEDDSKPLPVEVVPTRIVERLADGNYRVEGSQSFMIGKREYKVLVNGIVRAQDFNDEAVGATRLMEPKFDIVSTKKASSGVFR